MATNNANRLLIFRSKSLTTRWLSTVTTATTKKEVKKEKDKEESLYRRLFALGGGTHGGGGGGGIVSETLHEWIKEGKSVKKYHLIKFVDKLRKDNKHHLALQLYEWMEKGNTKLNNGDRARFIDLLAQTKGIASAESYFDSLQGSLKTQKTYGALLYCYCKENMLEKATEIFEKMKELNFASGALPYNNMMFLYMKVGQPEKVLLLAQEMEENSVTADLYTYNQLMNSYAAVEDFEAVEKVVEKMESSGVKQGRFTYGNLVSLYVNAGLVGKANDALQKLEQMEKLRDREAFHTLITLYSRTSNLSGVNRAWDSLKLAFPKTTNRSYLIMLLALSKLEDVKGLEEYFREWESSCSLYDVKVSNVILASYLDRDMIEEANLLCENVVKRGAKPNSSTLNLFMNFYLKRRQMDLAIQYMEKGASHANRKDKKWYPSEESVGMFLKYFEEEADVDNAEKFCNNMKKISRLNGKIYSSLLNTYLAAGKMEPQMRNRMKEGDIEITQEIEDLLQRVCPEQVDASQD